MNRLIVDTNLLIDHSKGKTNLVKKLLQLQKSREVELYINPVIISEFFADENLVDPTNFQKALSFINLFGVVNITKKVGLTAGELLRGNKVDHIADSLIAATCVEKKFKLATRNKKHFRKVKGLKFHSS